jgi:hypothetical protein
MFGLPSEHGGTLVVLLSIRDVSRDFRCTYDLVLRIFDGTRPSQSSFPLPARGATEYGHGSFWSCELIELTSVPKQTDRDFDMETPDRFGWWPYCDYPR